MLERHMEVAPRSNNLHNVHFSLELLASLVHRDFSSFLAAAGKLAWQNSVNAEFFDVACLLGREANLTICGCLGLIELRDQEIV